MISTALPPATASAPMVRAMFPVPMMLMLLMRRTSRLCYVHWSVWLSYKLTSRNARYGQWSLPNQLDSAEVSRHKSEFAEVDADEITASDEAVRGACAGADDLAPADRAP